MRDFLQVAADKPNMLEALTLKRAVATLYPLSNWWSKLVEQTDSLPFS